MADPPHTIGTMTLEEFQAAALRTANPTLAPEDRLVDAAAGLAEEAGEVLGLVRKRVFQQREVADHRLREELGDALWCLAVTADALGMSLGAVAAGNLEKLRTRHANGYSTGDRQSSV